MLGIHTLGLPTRVQCRFLAIVSSSVLLILEREGRSERLTMLLLFPSTPSGTLSAIDRVGQELARCM